MTYRTISVEQEISTYRNIKESEYWLNKLSGNLEKSTFPYDHTPAALPGAKPIPIQIPIKFPTELCSALMKLINQSDVRLHMVLVTGVILLLYKYTGNEDIMIGTPVYKQEIEGDFINTVLTLRNRIQGKMSFKQLLLQVRQTISEAIQHQNYPLEKLLYHLNISQAENGDFPLFDVLVLLENIHDPGYIANIQVNMVYSLIRTGEVLEGRVEYNPLLFRRSTIERLISHLFKLMQEALFSIDTPVGDMDILLEEERRQLLLDFNNTSAAYPIHKPLHRLFAEQVEKTPHHIAITDGVKAAYKKTYRQKQMTYRELNEKSNQLARALRQKGMQPDGIAAVIMDRCAEMVVGLLGILKSGGAYLPIDPGLPESPLIGMLEDSYAAVLLTKRDLLEGKSFTGIQGLHKPGITPHVTGPRPQITDFDRLSFPDRSLVNYEKYNQHIGLMMVKNSMSLQASRGCPYHCAYCHKIWPRTNIARSAENIFAEVMLYYNLGVRRFSFVDDIFNLNVKNSSRFFQLVIRHGLKVQLFFGLRGDILTREYIDLMVKAGTVRMAMALETASPRLQKLIGKNLNIEKLRQNLKYICETYPQVILELHSIIGFVTETEEEALMTLEFIKGLKWVHFNNVNILKIYPNTGMEALALKYGVSEQDIARSDSLAYHELPGTLPFSKDFVLKYQSEFLNDYFLSRERLLHVLAHQVKILTEDEIARKYNSYLPVEINCFDGLLEFIGITREELGVDGCRAEEEFAVPGLNRKLEACFPVKQSSPGALRVLLLDLSQYFTGESDMLYDVVEPPIGLMYVMTYINQQFANRVTGKIAKSRIDFDNYNELKMLVEEFRPQVIGMRTLTFYKDFFHKTVSCIRGWGFEGPIIGGGPYATSDYNTILKDENVDLIVIGEGEVTFARLIETIRENKGKLPGEEVLKEIPGIAFRSVMEMGSQRRGKARSIVMYDMLDLTQGSRHHPGPINRSTDLAYVIYTSGTTGRPKGVMIEHRNVVNVVSWFSRQHRLRSGTRVLQLSDYTFDASVNQVFATLLSGAALHVIPGDLRQNIEQLRQYIEKNQVHIINFVPAMLKELLAYGKRLESVQAVLCGGERLDDSFKDKLLEIGYRLYNQYGPSETTIDALVSKCSAQPVKLGKPISNARCYILDRDNKPVPPGAAGELCIGGYGVARGYLNNPELAAERFRRAVISHLSLVISSPKLSTNDRSFKLYKTGDLVRWLADGTIEFRGRMDNQVKIRGYRIEPGEIEHHLLKYIGVKEAVVVEREKEYLCAYVVPESQNELSTADIEDYLARHLPYYMVPACIVQIQQLPLTPNGKVDKKALPTPGSGIGKGYEHPTTETEKKLAKIWADILNLDQKELDTRANFFRLGGHSLKAIKLISGIHRCFNVEIPLADIFKSPTIKDLSSYIKSAGEKRYDTINPVEKKEYYPLSSAQKRLYVIQQMDTANTGYNIPKIMMVEGEPDRPGFEKASRKLIRRHESLRTSFHLVNEKPVQVVHDEVEFDIEYFKVKVEVEDSEGTRGLTPLPIEPETSTIKNFISPFDLSRVPLLRVGLIKTGETRYILMVDMHHIISDGISYEIFVNEFTALYQGEELPEPRIRYKDFSEWQNSRKQTGIIKQQEAYWLEQLKGEIPILNLPLDYSPPAIRSFEGDSVGFEIGKEETRALIKIALEKGATLYMVLLALYNLFLSRISLQEDILIGTPVAGRRLFSDLEQIIGMFVNMLVLRNYPVGEKTFVQFLEEVKNRTLGAFENQDYQFEELVEKVAVQRDTSRSPLFDAAFVFQNQDFPALEIPNLHLESYDHGYVISKFDLTLAGMQMQDRLIFSYEYCLKLFKKETIKRFIGYFKRILTAVVENPGIRLSAIDILPESERKQLLYDFNDTDADYPVEKTVSQLFADQVERTPDPIALLGKEEGWKTRRGEDEKNYKLQITNKRESFGQVLNAFGDDVSITYKELNEKSDQLAYILIGKGVKPDTIVGIMVGRSIEMIIGILGILKAGGAYMPIDPDYPGERTNFMLKDSNASMLLTGKDIAPSPSTLTSTCQVNPTNLAYVIYTSGTTGKPKGVLIEHKNVVRLLFNDSFLFNFDERDVWTMFHSCCFDFSVWEMYGALLYGGKLIVIPKIVTGDPKTYLKLLKQQGVTVLNQTPSAFYNLVNEELARAKKALKLKYIIFGGEALNPARLKEWKAQYPGTRIINMFGITETTVHVTFKEIGDAEIVSNRSNIGKPISTLKIYVQDRHQNLVPIGVPGELLVEGEGVGRGYLNRPELTARKFDHKRKIRTNKVPGKNPMQSCNHAIIQYHSPSPHHPNTPIPHSPIYRTGDRVKLLDNSEMEYLGRIDHQVKIRGYRVELGEIEKQLLTHGEIKDAVVMLNQYGPRERKNDLCAYIVANKELAAHELRKYLLKQLPGYMVPRYFVQIEQIPLTPNGKINREALPTPGQSYQGTDTDSDYVAPGTDIEKIISQIWKEVLDLDRVGIHDNFFDLGGNSFDIINLNNRLKEALKKEISIMEIFKYPTINSFAQYLETGEEGETISANEMAESLDIIGETMGTLLGDDNECK